MLHKETSHFSPVASAINLFSNEFLLKHSKVNHSSSFLSSVAKKGVPFQPNQYTS